MKVVKFESNSDLDRLEAYLRDRYFESGHAISWLPARLQDLIYRVGVQKMSEGREKSVDHIYLWEENGEIAACILPDGENIYMSIKNGFERLFPSMVDFSEKNCRSLFARAEDGSVKFWVAVSDSLAYAQEALVRLGYSKYAEKEYLNCVFPRETDFSIELPDGFRFLYGEKYPNEENKWSALRLGFHPDDESPDYKADMRPYMTRKNSSMYQDSFECVIVDENTKRGNDVCAYSFVYVDKRTGTALIEPVSTRKAYRRKGLGTAMLHGAILRCKKLGIEKCYVDSFGWRKDFYTAAGFITEDSVSFWYKTLN